MVGSEDKGMMLIVCLGNDVDKAVSNPDSGLNCLEKVTSSSIYLKQSIHDVIGLKHNRWNLILNNLNLL